MKNFTFIHFVLLIGFCLSIQTIYSQTKMWSEDFESNWSDNWYVEAGTWEVGTPTVGPDSVYTGVQCAATVLDGNYAATVSSKLIRHTKFTVPMASENPRLRFWHWYSFSHSDYGKVQIKVEGTEDWVDVSTEYTSTSSNIWTYPFIDLSGYAGQSVQVAFYFHASNYGGISGDDASTGWYIDDVEVISDPVVFSNPEGWENGIGDWASERGTWEIGTPTIGPDSVHNGVQCAATVLDGNYAATVSSRLISPEFTVPAALENPRLRFWHWYSFSHSDYGKVQIKVEGTEDWVDVSTEYTSTSSNIWTYPFIDLSGYAGQSVQVAFYFHASNYGGISGGDASTGWYIDDVEVISDPVVFSNPEGWENGIGDWASERGTWEIGTPTIGPDSVYNGVQCAATVLDGNYAATVSSRLISPEFTVPAALENPRLRFWHWYSFSHSDYGKVQIKVEGTEDWVDVSTEYTSTSSNIWTYPFIDLSGYAGQSVQVAFYFHASNYGGISGDDASTGWYIDDVILEPNISTDINQQEFKNLSVYPNPTESVVNVRLVSFDEVHFVLINMQGSVITREYATNGIINRNFNLSDLPQGVYLLRILSKDRNQTVKLIKK